MIGGDVSCVSGRNIAVSPEKYEDRFGLGEEQRQDMYYEITRNLHEANSANTNTNPSLADYAKTIDMTLDQVQAVVQEGQQKGWKTF